MRLLYASERPPYPFFLGGAARAAHMLLVRIATIPGAAFLAVGAKDYGVSAWRYPEPDEFATLGVRTADESNSALDCGYPVCLLPDFYRTLAAEIKRTCQSSDRSRLSRGRIALTSKIHSKTIYTNAEFILVVSA